MLKQYLKETFKYIVRSKPFIKNEIREVERLSLMDEDELYAYKEKQFLKIFRKAITRSKFYQKFYGDAGIAVEDIKSLKDLNKLPILTKENLRNNIDLVPIVPKWQLISANTSGTTGTPLTIYQNYKTIKLEQAYIWVRRKKYGFVFGDKLASLRGNLTNKKVKMYVHSSNTLYFSSYNINVNTVNEYYKELKSFNPKAIEGYPSSLYNLSVLLKEKGLRLKIPLAFTSSETLYPFQKIVIEETLSTKIYDRYGCTEKTISLAESLENGGYYEEHGYSINEFSTDSIITTSLVNHAFPLIRYQVNDQVILETKGHHPPNIKKIIGRTEDNIIALDGSIYGRLDHIFKNLNHVKMAQIIQFERGKININIVPDIGFTVKEEEIILHNLENRIGSNNLETTFNLINANEIIYTSRNKFRLVISYI